MLFEAPQPLARYQAEALQQAFGLLRSGQGSDALVIARRVVAQSPRAPDAHHLLAMCLAETRDWNEAGAAFACALAFAPEHPLILSNYAAMLRKAGRPAAALPLARRAADAAPDSVRAWMDLGTTALSAGEHTQAIAAARRAMELQADLASAWYLLGNASRADGNLETAVAAFRKAADLDPRHRSAWIGLGAAQRLSGRPDLAMSSYERAARLGKDAPLADAMVGALLDSGKVEEATELAHAIVAKHPDFVPGLVTLANLLWEYAPPQVSADKPLELFREAVDRQPGNIELRTAFVRFLLSARRPEEALDQIRQSRTHDDRPVLASMEADALDQLGDRARAGRLYAELYRDGGSSSPAFLNAYARHLLAAGEYAAAATRATEATRIDPRGQQAWAWLATAWRMLDDPREAWLCDYDRLIALVEIDPPPGFDQRTFLNALAAVLERMHWARREPVQQSLRGGSQTPGRLFGRPDPLIAATQEALLRGVERWLATLPADPTHPFLMWRQRSVRIGGSWSVKLWSSGSHANHVHDEGWMSSAYYVALPRSVRNASAHTRAPGAIQFGQPPHELGLDLPPRRVIVPETGKLALFPSYMWHGTIPFHDDAPRMTIAFDMTPLGDKR